MDIELVQKQLGQRLKSLRTGKSLRQEDLENFGFSYRHYGKIERGQVNPTLETLVKLCELFDISLSDLFAFMENDGKSSAQQESVKTKIQSILKENNESKIKKLEIFLKEIL